MPSLDKLLNPRSVAVIGASADPTRIGGRPLRYLREDGFAGDIYPVNPGRDEVQGLRSYPGIEAIPGPVDCAVLALTAEGVLPAIQSCAKKGVGAAVVFSAGFAEMGDAGRAQQAEMGRIARAANMRIVGPNCLGVFNVHSNAYLTFSGVFGDVVGTRGRLGLVSQSGGYAGEVVKQAKQLGLGIGTWMTTGNEVDVELGEAMLHMAHSTDVDVVVGYIEGVRNPRTFIDALETARRKRKPVIVLKVGRTEQGARAAASHTASLAGSDATYDAVLQQHGAYRARTTEEMLDVAYAASRGVFPAGRRIAILTNSGGIGVQAADFANDDGLEVSPTAPEVQARLTALSPNAATINPVDVTALPANDPPMYGKALDTLLGNGDFDLSYTFVGLIAGIPHITRPLADHLIEAARRHRNMPLAATVTAPPEVVAEYERAGFLCYNEPARAIRSLAALAWFADHWRKRDEATPAAPAGMPAIAAGTRYSEASAKALLQESGVPVPREILVADAEAALAAVRAIGRPVAIKVVSPDILHKTEVGGVALNVAPEQVGTTMQAMDRAIRTARPEARIEGYLVTPMLEGGIECIVGTTVDPVFGPLVLFGLGGVTVEVFKDVVTRVAPVSETEAREMIASIKSFPLLDGFRGAPRADLAALARAISRVSHLAHANAVTLRSLEINPLRVLPEGEGVVALDAVIEA